MDSKSMFLSGSNIGAPAAWRERLQCAHVLVVGDSILDRYWFGEVERISPEAPVPIVRVEREEHRLGGAANVALNARTFGARSGLLTVLGDDDAARMLSSMLEAEEVERFLGRDPSLKTTVKLRVSGRAQQMLRIDFESEPDHEVLKSMLATYEQALANYHAIIFSDYGKGGLAHIQTMIEAARSANKLVLVDPKGSDYSRYAGATVITPNRAELARVIGAWQNDAELERRAQELRRQLNLGALLLTRSEEGMSLFDGEGHLRIPARTQEVFDVTGAGDTVIAVLGALVAAGVPMREAVPMANCAGGIVVGKFGTASVTPEEMFA